jgi:hypothetical protein
MTFNFDVLLQKLSAEAQAPALPAFRLLNGSANVKQALYSQGWEWMPVIYQFWITDSNYNLTLDRLAERIDEYIPVDYVGPAHFDLEHENHIAHICHTRYPLTGSQHKTSKRMFIDILDLGRKMRPNVQWGNYGLPGAMKWPPGGKYWSQWTDEEKKAYIDRTLSMTDLWNSTGCAMSRAYDSYPINIEDPKEWQNIVQAEWMLATVDVVKAVQAVHGFDNHHTFNHRAGPGPYVGIRLTNDEIWTYQVLPALLAGWHVQWWGASAPAYYLYEQKDPLKRDQYMLNVLPELKENGIDVRDEMDVRRYFDYDAATLGTWLANKIKTWAWGSLA